MRYFNRDAGAVKVCEETTDERLRLLDRGCRNQRSRIDRPDSRRDCSAGGAVTLERKRAAAPHGPRAPRRTRHAVHGAQGKRCCQLYLASTGSDTAGGIVCVITVFTDLCDREIRRPDRTYEVTLIKVLLLLLDPPRTATRRRQANPPRLRRGGRLTRAGF